MIAALFHGVILAFGLILPLGAQNVYVFNQGASQPRLWRAMPVVITAALCDTLLILLAVLGISLLVLSLPMLYTAILIGGVCFLIYMGWSIWNSKSVELSQREAALPPKKQILFAMSVSLLNPHAILDTVGIIGTSSLSYTGTEKVAFTAACIIVSCIWFLFLAIAGRAVGNFDTKGTLLSALNKVSALIIWGVAGYIAYLLIV